jgi:uncharacterized phage protein (TIGR02218 family)
MANFLLPDLTTMAFCWRLARRDGVTLGFTSHDQDVVLAGLRYRAAPGMLPSALEMSDGLDPSAIELSGALTSDALNSDDLAAGRWDGASLNLYLVDWTHPDVDPIILTSGTFGPFEMADAQFTVSLLGATHRLDTPATEATSPMCRARLGDKRCRVDMAGRVHKAQVVAVSGVAATLAVAIAGSILRRGTLRWCDGPNAGLESAILSHVGAQIILADPPPFPVAVNTSVILSEGCDNRIQTCIERFNNAENFRGEPYLPGNDLLTRYAS